MPSSLSELYSSSDGGSCISRSTGQEKGERLLFCENPATRLTAWRWRRPSTTIRHHTIPPHTPAVARTLILEDLFDQPLYKARRAIDPLPNRPCAQRAEVFDGFASWCYTRAIRENESQAAFTLRTMADKPEQAGSGKPGGPTTILVVDDSQEVRDLFRTVLQHHGYEVVLAADGESALKAYHQHRGVIHLLVIDVVMPGMSGPKLAAKFVALRPDIKVLFVSAFVNETVLQGKIRPEDRFLAKPIPPERLITKVQEMLAA